jgi:hypothetical protein
MNRRKRKSWAVPTLYMLMYQRLWKQSARGGGVDMRVARKTMARAVFGLDRLRADRVLEEMKVYGLLASKGRGYIVLNKVDLDAVEL